MKLSELLAYDNIVIQCHDNPDADTIARGFIKAEVVNYQDLLDNGSLAAAREKGIVGMEGKDYVVKDGDVILFRFNV